MNDAKEGAFYIYIIQICCSIFCSHASIFPLTLHMTKRPVVRAHYSKKAHHMLEIIVQKYRVKKIDFKDKEHIGSDDILS
jgi:hypothetical protein